VDTATPDSGDVEALHGPRRGETKVRVSPRSGPGFKQKKPSAKYLSPRPYLWRSTCCWAECQSSASGGAWANRAEFECDCPGGRLFFAFASYEPPKSSCASFSPSPEPRSASGRVQRS